MSTKNDGGPAFPRAGLYYVRADGAMVTYDPEDVMTLRDWFAGQALAGLLAVEPSSCSAQDYAQSAFEQADAMLAQREK
jgi:hypothetical protein